MIITVVIFDGSQNARPNEHQIDKNEMKSKITSFWFSMGHPLEFDCFIFVVVVINQYTQFAKSFKD